MSVTNTLLASVEYPSLLARARFLYLIIANELSGQVTVFLGTIQLSFLLETELRDNFILIDDVIRNYETGFCGP